MKTNDRKNNWMPPPSDRPLNDFDEARRIFDHAMTEVKRHSEVEREVDRHRSPLLKAVGWLLLASILASVAVGAYGIYNFPYAPLREKNGVYYGRYNTPSTKTDYERYKVWEKAFFASFAASFTLGFSFMIWDSRLRRKNNLPE